MKELEITVTGMHCGGCEKRVQNAISELKEVKEVKANHETSKVNITFKKDVGDEIKDKIKSNIERMDEFKVS